MSQSLSQVQVDGRNRPRDEQLSYVNPAYVGSVNSVNFDRRRTEANTGVYREQYWTCARWPFATRVLAIAVGVLLGTLIGLIISVFIADNNVVTRMFRAVPD